MKEVKLTSEEIRDLCLSLATLFHAGVSAGDAFTLMAQDEDDPIFRQMLTDMARWADEGASLSAVFQESGRMPDYVCGLLEVGGKVGRMEQTLAAACCTVVSVCDAGSDAGSGNGASGMGAACIR